MNANVWLGLLFFAAAGQVTLLAYAQRRDSRLERKVDAVCDLLMVWAQVWGEDPITTRIKLNQVLDHHFEHDTDDSTSNAT